jgi:hypothetical protein
VRDAWYVVRPAYGGQVGAVRALGRETWCAAGKNLGGKRTDRKNGKNGCENANDSAVSRRKIEGDLSPRCEGIFGTVAFHGVCVTCYGHGSCEKLELHRAFCLETVRTKRSDRMNKIHAFLRINFCDSVHSVDFVGSILSKVEFS